MGKVHVEVVKGRLQISKIVDSVRSPSAGGTVIFVGTVRNRSRGMKVERMEVEAAVDLANSDLRRISEQACKEYRVSRISVSHRIGRLKVCEPIVVIAVSAPHRKDAFSACRYVIDQLKKTTPIWKKEFGLSGSRWVENER